MKQAIFIAALALSLAACSGDGGADKTGDLSKLTPAMAERARSIQARADKAVAAAEREAADDLAKLNQESAPDPAAAPSSTNDAAANK